MFALLTRHSFMPMLVFGLSIFSDAALARSELPPLLPAKAKYDGPKPLWKARVRPRGVPPMRPRHQALVDLKQWGAEPVSPRKLRVRRFARSLRQLCGKRLRSGRSWRYARWILRASRRFHVDPFMVAALVYSQSGCNARLHNAFGSGLTAINWRMHHRHIKRRRYRYWIRDAEGGWQAKSLRLRYPFYVSTLRRPATSIYFTAALLHVWNKQCPLIDDAFGSVPHRSPVSHFIWGDRVRDAAYEDKVLQARRRLLVHYTRAKPPVCGKLEDLQFRSPLAGAPLKVLSGWGERRDRGRRRHKGIDLFASIGTPVYSVADGMVSFAGVTIKRRRRRRSVNLPYKRARRVRSRRLGAGGLLVLVRHADGIVTGYMHLSRYFVERGQKVKAGDLLGYVGASGVKVSKPHLHFEMRLPGRHHVDPIPLMCKCLLPPDATYIGRWRRLREGAQRFAHSGKVIREDDEDFIGPLPPVATGLTATADDEDPQD